MGQRLDHVCLFPNASGYWNDSSNAGVFYRNWNNYRSNNNNNYGFRAADYVSIPDILWQEREDWRHRELSVPPLGEICLSWLSSIFGERQPCLNDTANSMRNAFPWARCTPLSSVPGAASARRYR
jgi:hypothetical protein